MQYVGWVAVVVMALVGVAGLVLGVMSIPDILRYMRMRRM